jgi:hypothetical protein
MEAHEIQEQTEHAHNAGEKGIGLTMAVVAVLLAIATLLSHRSHTEEVLLQGQINDQWGFYQAKHTRAHTYGELSEIEALLPNGSAMALKNLKISTEEECGAPPEEGCSSPVLKNSAILKQLVEEEKAARPAGGHEAAPEHESQAGETASGEGAGKSATPAKEEHTAKSAHAEGGAEGKREKTVKEGAVKIQEKVREMENEKHLTQKRADYFDGSELFLEISIVLCSIALLSENKTFWHISFISTIGGICVAAWGFLLH